MIPGNVWLPYDNAEHIIRLLEDGEVIAIEQDGAILLFSSGKVLTGRRLAQEIQRIRLSAQIESAGLN